MTGTVGDGLRQTVHDCLSRGEDKRERTRMNGGFWFFINGEKIEKKREDVADTPYIYIVYIYIWLTGGTSASPQEELMYGVRFSP